MGIKYLQRFNIRGNHGNNRAFLLALQFRRTQFTKRTEDFITKHRKETERYIVIAVLLKIAERTTENAAANRQADNQSIRQRNGFAKCFCNADCSKQSYTHSTEETYRAIDNGKYHYVRKTTQEKNELCHDNGTASAKFCILFHFSTSAYPSSRFFCVV